MESIPSKRKRILQGTSWFHGTTIDELDSIKKGICAKHNIRTAHETDFGYGFYLKSSYEEAAKYIYELQECTESLGNTQLDCIVCEFFIKPLDYFESSKYNAKLLCKYDDEFANIVFDNRCNNVSGVQQHEYDIIYGVESDSVPTKEMLNYRLGNSTKEQVIEAFKKSTSMKQLSIHNQEICDMLILKAVYSFDNPYGERRELKL